jgi:hypothetical protein
MAEPPKKAATKANAAKQEADTGVAAPKAGGGVMKKGKHVGDKAAKKKEKDLNSPKKPVAGAYGVFLAANREAIKKTLPADHKITDVAKAAGTRWAAVSRCLTRGSTRPTWLPTRRPWRRRTPLSRVVVASWRRRGRDWRRRLPR